ncbi:Glycosyltransferase involved in cell wall bisynthesis [Pseudobutyrivibrio sp. 49]|uniref:glycosyltransferase n=1 Tax=Pseudobutyrivibrio sp. 49 TaxID=1855344 RepID=UPI00088FEE72|nr:glycosyltransferase [Pseudobutyrivibrio sp. 49]SDH60824.1 Glycosyltransferase involved in cell wall bisynthesis [Pseudobutyrivibrio sp. 49]
MQPKVSVIVPIYNVEPYLRACIDSLVGQTLSDIEIILVNDCSPDNSIAIMREYEAKYDNIIVIDSKVNLKQGGAKNLGMKIAKGEYIGFIDSDDYISLSTYEKLYNMAKENNADCVASQIATFTGETITDEELKPGIIWTDELLTLDGKELTDDDRRILSTSVIGGLVTRIYRREVLIDNDMYFPQGMRFEDNYWGFLINEYINKICLYKEPLYYYRQISESTVHDINGIHQLDRYKAIELLYDELKKRGLFEKYYKQLEYIVITLYFRNTYYVLTNANYFYPKEIIRSTRWMEENFPEWRDNAKIQKDEMESLKAIVDSIGTSKWFFDNMILCVKRKIKKCIERV